MGRTFGVVTSGDASFVMVINSIRYEETGEDAAAYDEQGNITDIAVWGVGFNYTVQGNTNGESQAYVGDILTVNGYSLILTNVVIEEAHNDYAKVTYSGKSAANIILLAPPDHDETTVVNADSPLPGTGVN